MTSRDQIRKTTSDLTDYLIQWLDFQAAYFRTPGIQAAIRVGEDVVLDYATGHANLATGEELRTDHVFRIASHSKTYTATAIMQLVEAGTLRLDDTLSSRIPELSAAPIGAVTIREVLGHQGGVVRDGVRKSFWQRLESFPDRAELLRMATEGGVVFEPNEHFKYSNVSYSLLGLVIEAATGGTYRDYITEHILTPLALDSTGVEFDPELADRFATGHTGLLTGDDTREPIRHSDSRAYGPAGGFYATARDMTTYGAAHFFGDQTLLTDASKRLMQRTESVIKGRGTPAAEYGVGMSLRQLGARDLVGHSGGYPGHITQTYIDPTEQLVVSVLTNAVDGPASNLAAGLIRLIDLALNDADDTPAGAAAPGEPTDRVPLSSFTGRFAGLWGITDIVEAGDRLLLITPTAPNPAEAYSTAVPLDAHTLQTESKSGFGAVGEKLYLERDDDGAIVSVHFSGGPCWPVAEFLSRRSDLAQADPD